MDICTLWEAALLKDGKGVISSINEVSNVVERTFFSSEQEDAADLCFLGETSHMGEWEFWGVEASQDLTVNLVSPVSVRMVMMEDRIRSIELWLRLVKQQQQPLVDPNLDPVLLDPGIPRSILMADDNGKEERMWVRIIIGADHEFRAKLWSEFDRYTGKILIFPLFLSPQFF
ncbi:hypothetical protein GW17_00041694 [Ensete ventricosum]|nr:hypothetical protein GW17_00041694 [Ensete ventricosum]